MIDEVKVVRRSDGLSDAAEGILEKQIRGACEVAPRWEKATIDVIPHPGDSVPLRPFLHRGDWMHDGQGALWTIVTAFLHEDDDGDGHSYLWHEYEAVGSMHHIA